MPIPAKFKGFVEIRLWGRPMGVAAWDKRGHAIFEYTKAFIAAGLPVAPLKMPLAARPYSFPALARSEDFQGLPGMLADALPDKWGNKLIERWLMDQGRDLASVSPIEKLCFIGNRAMGALEFKPFAGPAAKNGPLHVAALLDLAQEILKAKATRTASLSAKDKNTLAQVILVGSSVGGNRAKAIIAWNRKTNEVRAGDIPQPKAFEPWIIKFDETGSGNGAQPKGYGRLEYAYHLMAKAAGIEMADCRLWEEHGRAHFMTRRFDRLADGSKLHTQSLSALAHLDRDKGPHSYETAFQVLREIQAPANDASELFRRAVFNVAAKNRDDHAKNFSFLMTPGGRWRLAPAFDVTWAYNPKGVWTQQHQLSIGGKTTEISRSDLVNLAKRESVRQGAKIVEQVLEAVDQWPDFAAEAEVSKDRTAAIAKQIGNNSLA